MIDYDTIYIGKKSDDLNQFIHVAIANICIKESDVESSYLGNANTSQSRLAVLVGLLRNVASYRNEKSEQIDLLLFPEVSLPHSWEAMIVTWSRKHNIGVICGLEHQIHNGFAYNEILSVLPYRRQDGTVICAPIKRVKYWYSPEETFVLDANHLKIPKHRRDKLQLIVWRGASLCIYNCYELTDIRLRSLFLGKVDFLVALEFNKDINYFANIVEAASRDIHCYFVQVNDSKFGDSRVVSPSKTEIMNPLRIKGGENVTFLTMKINLNSLRQHQSKKYGLQKTSEDFKPTPPHLDINDVRTRIERRRKRKNVG